MQSKSVYRSCHPEKREQGIALLVALFALSILTLIGVALVGASSVEVLINDNYKDSRVAYYAAESGTEEARYRLGNGAGGSAIVPPSNITTAIYIRANTGIDPTSGSASSNKYFDSEYFTITKRDNYGSQTSTASGLTTAQFATTIQGSSNQVPYAWVKITRKTETLAGQNQNVDNTNGNSNTAVYYGTNTVNGAISQYVRDAANSLNHDGNPVYLITALSLDSRGAQRKIQTEITMPPTVTATAALNSYQQVDFSGNLNISGEDECNPGEGVYGVSSHGTVDTPGPSQMVYGQPEPICAGCPFNYDIPTLIDQLKNSSAFQSVDAAGTSVSCSGSPVSCSGSNVDLGDVSTGAMKYYYSPGNLSITSNNSHGYGILVVDGDVTLNGGVYYEGIIIARGTFNFTGGGGTQINIRGAVLAGQSITDTTSDVGGSIEVQYNSCSIANVFNGMPLIMLSFKDRALY